MGQARQKMLEAGKIIKFDFAKPEFHITRADREWLQKNPDGTASEERVQSRATRFAIGQIVAAAFPQGMDRKDGKTWAAWQEILDDESTDTMEVNKGMVSWLSGVIAKEDLKVQPAMAQWREVLVDYLAADESDAAE